MGSKFSIFPHFSPFIHPVPPYSSPFPPFPPIFPHFPPIFLGLGTLWAVGGYVTCHLVWDF